MKNKRKQFYNNKKPHSNKKEQDLLFIKEIFKTILQLTMRKFLIKKMINKYQYNIIL